MKCTYKITIDGKEKLFSSEQELDSFLTTYFQDYTINENDKSFHIDPIQNTVDKIQEISKKVGSQKVEYSVVSDDGESEKFTRIPGSIGVTKFLQEFGDPNNLSEKLVTKFDLDSWKKIMSESMKSENPNITEDEINRLLDIEQKNWVLLTEYGTELHAIFESILKNTEYKPKYLTPEQFHNVKRDFKNLITYLKELHGRNAKFISEVPLITKYIDEHYSAAGITSINGLADLIVVDENGTAHVYDFKVSRKDVGNWEQQDNSKLKTSWHSTKKQAASYQLASYVNMLSQHDIPVGRSSVIPIKLNLSYGESGEISSLDSIILNTEFLRERFDGSGKWKSIISAKHDRIIRSIIPKSTLLDNIDLITSIQEPMSKIAPNYELTTQVQRKSVTIDRYRDNRSIVIAIPEGDPDRSKGAFKVINRFKKGKVVYCNTEEEIRAELENLVERENAQRGDEIFQLADTIEAISKGEASMKDLASGSNEHIADYCKRIFRKYIDDRTKAGWEFQYNPKFVAAGIFVFKKGGRIEIVSLTYSQTHELIHLGRGTSLLGAKKQNHEVDNHKIMDATNGNLDLMKVMCLINSDPEFKNYKVTKIGSFNIWMQTGNETYLETLYDNFMELCDQYDIDLNIDKSNFADVLESTVTDIRDVAGSELMDALGDWTLTFSADKRIEAAQFLIDKLNKIQKLPGARGLREAISSGNFNFDDEHQLAYMLIGKALNKINDYEVYIEKNPAQWIGFDWKNKHLYTGLNINSPGTSASLNIQSLSKIYTVAETQIRRRELSYRPKYVKIIQAFYEYNARNPLLGGEVKFYDNLFVKDENGNIDKTFRLRNPDDNLLAKEESDFIRMFLEIINDLRFAGNSYKIEKAKADGTYYEVPVLLGSMSTQVHHNSFGSALKTKFDETLNWMRLLPEQERRLTERKQAGKVFNKFKLNGINRKYLIENVGVNKLETQLEDILLDYIHAYEMEDVMKEFLPRMQGIKIALQYQQAMYGVVTDASVEYINKFIDLNVYSKPIMNPQLHTAYKALSVVKQITTATTLGFNYKSGMRELLQGMWIHLSRTMAESYGKDQFNKTDIAKAWKYIFQESWHDPNKVTFLDALNIEYGMANADSYQVQERLSSSRTGIKNFDSDALYIFNRIPDTYHRLGLLIAKMIHEGCFEAHSIVDDQLVYDFKKDNRFNLLNDPNADKKSKAYREQRTLYTAMREQFNKEGFNIKDGEDLPRAYTMQEGTSIKSFSELCFGHYDRNTQMLAKQMFLGSFYLQFRTFLSAKLEQWILKPGTYNQGVYDYATNSEGVRYVKIYEGEDTDTGMPNYRITLESNLNGDEEFEYVKEWKGRFMEGIAYSMLDFGKTLFTMDFKKWNELWQNPTKRANFKLFLHDMVWMSILAWLTKLIFLTEDELGEDPNAVSQFAGSVLSTSFADGPIHNILGGMVSDLNPPTYSIAKDLFNNTWDLITGTTGFAETMCDSFGALRAFKYVGNRME